MTFNVNEFSSRINAVGGLQKPSLFYVEIAPPPWMSKSGGGSFLSGLANFTNILGGSNLRFLCSSATIPGISTLFSDVRRQGYGPLERRANGVVFPNVDAVFFIDNRNTVLRFFHRWMQNIVQYNGDGSEVGMTSNFSMPYEVGYYDDYVTTITIYFYDATGGSGFNIRRIQLREAFPVSVGDVGLNWASADEVANMAVSFTYRYFSTDWIERPGGQTGFGRILSALDQFQEIRSSVSTISTLRAPSSVADAVNVVNNVGLVTGL